MTTSDSGTRIIDRSLLTESIVIMIFAAVMFGVTYSFDKVPAILAQGIQPTVFPRAILAIVFCLAALQAVRAMRLSAADIAKLKPAKSVPLIVFVTAALLIGFAFVIPILGTFPSIVLFLPALAIVWGERRWLLMLLSFAGFTVFVYVLFRLIMNVPLP